MCYYRSSFVLMCLYGCLYSSSFCVLINFSGFLWVFVGPYSSLRCLMGPSGFLCVFFGSLRFLMGLYRSLCALWILLGSYGSL